MSSFDTVRFECPECRAGIEAQSKAGDCNLEWHDCDDVPAHIAHDLAGSSVHCWGCGFSFTIATIKPVPSVALKLVEPLPEEEEEEDAVPVATIPVKPKTYDLMVGGWVYARNLPGDNFEDAVRRFAQTEFAKPLGAFDPETLTFNGVKACEA